MQEKLEKTFLTANLDIYSNKILLFNCVSSPRIGVLVHATQHNFLW